MSKKVYPEHVGRGRRRYYLKRKIGYQSAVNNEDEFTFRENIFCS